MPNEATPNDPKLKQAQIKALEKRMKEAFKAGHFDEVKSLGEQLKGLDEKNHVAALLEKKIAKQKAKMEQKARKEKTKEYEKMLKKLYKSGDMEKVMELAKEYQAFAPQVKNAEKWLRKAQKELDKKQKSEPEKKQEDAKQTAAAGENVFLKAPEKSAEEKKDESLAEQAEPKASGQPITLQPLNTPTAPTAGKPASAMTDSQAEIDTKPQRQTSQTADENKNIFSQPVNTKASEKEAPESQVQSADKKPDGPAQAETGSPVTHISLGNKPEAAQGSAKPEAKQGNVFTKVFGGEEPASKKSIIDTIVEKSEPKKEKKPEPPKVKPVKKKKVTEDDGTALLKFSKVFLNFSILFILLTGAFLYVEYVDKDNTVLGIFGIQENTGGRLHRASQKVAELKKEEQVLKKEIERFKGGYNDNDLQIVNQIIDDRLNWPDILAKIKEVTDSIYEFNDFFQYIEYDNYAFDAEKRTVRVSGSLSDPLGRNLTKLVELEEAFKYYPRDKDNPEDDTKPYFQNFKEFTSFSKTLDQQTGKYVSRFQLSFALNK